MFDFGVCFEVGGGGMICVYCEEFVFDVWGEVVYEVCFGDVWKGVVEWFGFDCLFEVWFDGYVDVVIGWLCWDDLVDGGVCEYCVGE